MTPKFWIKHPRSKEPDTMLTLATYASFAAIFKFLTNGVELHIEHYVLNLGTVDAGLVAAILTPTLGSYVMRKNKSSPDKPEENSKP